MSISILGSGAFGTALAISMSHVGKDVILWGRDRDAVHEMQKTRKNVKYLPDACFPEKLIATSEITVALKSEIILLAVPMQKLPQILEATGTALTPKLLVACSKGLQISTGIGATALIEHYVRDAKVALLSGPSFASDLSTYLPTALTLACRNKAIADELQDQLSSSILRLYTNTDVIGVELGGALKNVVAIASGICIGAGLGHSARAALMTRGFAEMRRVAPRLGANLETLSGLSGLGDLSLTCMSHMSRNFQYGHALGKGEVFPKHITVEGIATSQAILNHPKLADLEMPIFQAVADLAHGRLNVKQAITILMQRPQGEE